MITSVEHTYRFVARGSVPTVNVLYEYKVGSEIYTGSRVAYATDAAEVEIFKELGYQEGDSIVIWYDAKMPERSVLVPSVLHQSVFLQWLVIFVGAAIGLFYAFVTDERQ